MVSNGRRWEAGGARGSSLEVSVGASRTAGGAGGFLLVRPKRLDYSADTTFGPDESNWATLRRLAGARGAQVESPSLGNRAQARVRGTSEVTR